MLEKKVTIVNKLGLHARPAVMLVKTASEFEADVKLAKGTTTVDAKSIMGILILAAGQGSILTIITDGRDEKDAMDAVVKLFEDGFGEDQ